MADEVGVRSHEGSRQETAVTAEAVLAEQVPELAGSRAGGTASRPSFKGWSLIKATFLGLPWMVMAYGIFWHPIRLVPPFLSKVPCFGQYSMWLPDL